MLKVANSNQKYIFSVPFAELKRRFGVQNLHQIKKTSKRIIKTTTKKQNKQAIKCFRGNLPLLQKKIGV